MDMKRMKNDDPLRRSAEKQADAPEFSPMNPPDPYAPPAGVESVPYESMPVFLRGLMDEHESFRAALESFEGVLVTLREKGLERDDNVEEGLRTFFTFLDEHMLSHQLNEEKLLFPRLHDRLIETHEHSQGEVPRTAIDMLEDDHSKVMQLAAVTFSFLGLAARLPDAPSRAIVLDAAIEQGNALIELLRLHMFREDNVVFALAANHLDASDFDAMSKRASRATG